MMYSTHFSGVPLPFPIDRCPSYGAILLLWCYRHEAAPRGTTNVSSRVDSVEVLASFIIVSFFQLKSSSRAHPFSLAPVTHNFKQILTLNFKIKSRIAFGFGMHHAPSSRACLGKRILTLSRLLRQAGSRIKRRRNE